MDLDADRMNMVSKNDKIIISVVVPPLDQEFDYYLASKQPEEIKPGYRIVVDFNNRLIPSYVVKVQSSESYQQNFKLKEVGSKNINHPCFLSQQLKFFQWIADYYREPLSKILDTAIPKFQNPKWDQLLTVTSQKIELRGPLQSKVYKFIESYQSGISRKKVLENFPTAAPVLKKLQERDAITVESIEDQVAINSYKSNWAKSDVDLTKEQQDAYLKISGSIDQKDYAAYLLYGVTGSGKTEVYLEACNHALKKNKGVMIIVPEIALTPQLIDRFAARLEEPFAVIHSGLTPKERWSHWKALLDGSVKVVIGVRSAVFAPVHDLGLIIVDEEHDNSFKQSDNLRYNARDLAVKRAQLSNATIVLGSATPTLESLYNTKKKKYELLKLSAKFAKSQKPLVHILDLGKLKKKDYVSKNVTAKLAEQVEHRLSKNEQVFILYNRRGFASYLICDKCQSSIHCPSCDLTLTYYKKRNDLLCHYCGYHSAVPEYCRDCHNSDPDVGQANWILMGAGTEKINLELAKLFPSAKIARMDRDVIYNAEQYRDILTKVREQEVDILVGTQMIAKGHDLPNVTLVGVIDCDVGLHLPDFRATEKVFQLLTQVSGRAGRGEIPGEIIFQTRLPDHPSIQFTKSADFPGFANYELNQRKLLNYPPFTKLLRVIVSSTEQGMPNIYCQKVSQVLNESIQSMKLPITLLGPVPAPIEKLRQHWRWHMIFKSQDLSALHKIMDFFQAEKSIHKKLRITLDLDPQDLM